MNDKILPYGTTLKPLLQFSNITESSIRKFLNQKGIYLSEYKRDKMIPILTTTFISPEEFEQLSKMHKTKEAKVKVNTKRVAIKEEVDLIEMLDDYEFDTDEDSSFMNYTYTEKPELHISNNLISFPYEIIRTDRSQDWTAQHTTHKGNVKIKKNGDTLEVELESNHTSNETKDINQKIISDVTNHLKNKDIISEKEKISFVKFEDFDNLNRFIFMLSFKEIDSNINFSSINNIEFGPDTNEENPPEDIEWIKDHVRRLIVKGEKLEEIEFLKDSENQKYLVIEKITYEYSFNLNGHTGEAYISMGFPSILKRLDPMSPFEFYIENLKINWSNNNYVKKVETEVKDKFYQCISNKRDSIYQELKIIQ